MKDEKTLDRRAFTVASLMAALGGATVSVSACGGGGGGGTTGGAAAPTGASPMPPAGDVSGTVASNHGHVATVTAAQLGAGEMVTLNIRGNSNHPHTVQLSADDVMAIARGERIVVRSSNDDGHFHEVTFN